MIKRLIEKLKTLRLCFVIYSIFKRNKSDFYKNLMRDWGKDDVYGPWTKHKNDGKLRFYKSYYMIDGDFGDVPIFNKVWLKKHILGENNEKMFDV